jgi:hypothetical protein
MYLLTYQGGALLLFHDRAKAEERKDLLCRKNPAGCDDIRIEPVEIADG